MSKKLQWPIIIAAAGIIVVLTAFLLPKKLESGPKKEAYETVVLAKGDIEDKVSSSGSMIAVGTVKVLAQMTGTVENLYVDYNDKVTKGQRLAELNTDSLKIQAKEAQASVLKAKAQLEKDTFTYNNNKKLFDRNLISETDYNSGKAAVEESKADLMAAEAAYEQILIKINQYALITAPIDGIILARNIDKGQTVVSGGSTETELFTLADSLDVMEIEVDVDELDISKIAERQKVSFSVQSYANRKFNGVVRQIRKVPTTTNNVVNYTVVVRADNPDGVLLPGMTATVEFLVSEKKNVLVVPNSALRFKPSKEIEAAARRKLLEERIKDRPADEQKEILKKYDEAQKAGTAGPDRPGAGLLGGLPRPPMNQNANRNAGQDASGQAGKAVQETRKALWLLEENGTLTLRMVKVGTSDSNRTEILDAPNLEGKNAVIRMK